MATRRLCELSEARKSLEFRLGITESITYLSEYLAETYVVNFTHDVKDQNKEGWENNDADGNANADAHSAVFLVTTEATTHFSSDQSTNNSAQQ
ncbi:hypothetical protein BBBOND_0110190 [Babesia bigemina]|uniref:Uncharacterized protein n=1 Tax=Babesia bigemina TaxID=5866 RepID=A0A061D1Q3_BABBI|nr:hypothetical protein BBBOND_0110190 [Babesia bigemina]CDR94721.1 hypothetical protein BBBOND_0110190 [Babesia bigemina]|eukprot:XP_012766907.1 hypothetical protein BBBOND_0110190 [Babesia bigemina]